MTDEHVVEVRVHVAAQPETVFRYFTDPARYVQWMGSDATLEPVPGGPYRVRMRGGVEAAGEFVEVDPPSRLVFTWGWTHDHAVPPGTTRVVITLHPENGGTRVVLQHPVCPIRSSAITTARDGNSISAGSTCGSVVSIPARTRTPDPVRHQPLIAAGDSVIRSASSARDNRSYRAVGLGRQQRSLNGWARVGRLPVALVG